MITAQESAGRSEDLKEIAEQLRQLTAAVQEQNAILKACVLQPEGRAARFMVGMYGALEVIT